MKSRPRLTRALVLVSTIVAVSPLIDGGAALATVEEQRTEVQRIVDELDRLHERADILAEDYAVAVDDESQLKIEIGEAEQRVADKEAELNALRGDLAEVAVRSFTGAGTDVLGPLFSDATSASAGLRRDQYSRVALNVGTGTTDDLDELISDLDEERHELEDKRQRAAQLAEEIAAKQEQVEQLTAEYIERRTDAEARLGELIAEEEARRSAAALAELQRQAAQAVEASANNAGNVDSGNTGNTGNTGNSNDAVGGDDGGAQPVVGGDTGGGDAPAADPNAGGESGGSDAGGDPSGGDPNVPVSGLAGTAINAAMSQIGVPYRYASSEPGVAFDCSGLTHYAWGQAGVYLPRNSRAQAAATPHVPAANAQPGDLIFYYSPISHVGIYLGNGQLVHAPNSGNTVTTASVNWSKVTAVSRPG
jgi:cell wall-associated NlpC family hydrolase